jgi:glycosyltransferase involved in cell wall biosynthesis
MIDNKGLVLCLTPVYNDWESLIELVDEIRGVFSESADKKFKILAIDDGSTEQNKYPFNKSDVEIISLKKNVGHQRAIAIGIQYVYNKYLNNQLSEKKLTAHHLVVLDSDGEDKPSDILSMVDAADQQVVFAQRTKRSETLSFKLGYWFYKKIFRLLTGKSISFGNFCAIPVSLLKPIALNTDIWNHFSGSIIKSRIPYATYPTVRGKRHEGKSKMNTTNLIVHGLSAVSIYFDVLCIRLLRFSLIALTFCSIGVGYIFYQKIFTENAIPGWASSLVLIIFSIIIQLFSVTFVVLLFQLNTRKRIEAPYEHLFKKFLDQNEA